MQIESRRKEMYTERSQDGQKGNLGSLELRGDHGAVRFRQLVFDSSAKRQLAEFAGKEVVTMRSCDFQRGFPGMNRRDFLFGSAVAAAAFATRHLAGAQDAATRAKLDRISLLTNDFYGLLPEVWGDWNKRPAPLKMDMLDLPDQVADRLHLHNLEVCNINLLSMEPSYIGEFKQRLHNAKSKVVDLIVELDRPQQPTGAISVCVLPIVQFVPMP